MKVLWYISRENLSNAGEAGAIHSREDVLGLQNCGWEVTLFGRADRNYKPSIEINEYIVQNILPLTSLCYLLFEFKMVSLLLKARKKPDFVFFRGPTDSIIIGIFLKLKGYPFGMELNGVFQYRYEKKKNLRNFIEMISDKFFMKNCNVLIPGTEELKLIAINESKPGCIICVAMNAVDPDKIKPCHKTTIDKRFKFKIGFLGKCFEFRGHEVALNLISELKKKGFIIGFRFIGGGPNVNKLKELADKLEISNQIEFIDEILPEHMGMYVSDCDIMWAYFDNWDRYKITGLSSMKIWTYLSLGKPILLRNPGVFDYYKTIPGIFLFKGGNVKDLSDYIIHIWKETKRAGLIKIGMEGREYVIKNVSWKKHVDIIDKSINEYYHKHK